MVNSTETYEHSYIAEDKLLSSLSVYNVGSQKCKPGYQWGPGIRDHYLIHHVLSGKGYFEICGKKYHLKMGDTFLIYPNMEACYRADEEDPWSYTWVGFDGTDALHLLNHTDFSEESPVLEQAEISEEIERKIRKVYEAKGNTFYAAVSMTGALYSMIAMLMENSVSETKQKDLRAIHVEQAVQYIAEHYSYPITVESIAGHTGVCRSYLYRMFREVLKKSPKDYVEEYRIRQACQMLGETKLPITSIAHSVGYEDNLYFSKAFKKCKGQTPSEYRKKQYEKKSEEKNTGRQEK
ncbi:MAG: AraC family transcriptional regulator [Lachnospiraceae bacterium]